MMTSEEFATEIKWFVDFYLKELNAHQTKIWFELWKGSTKEVFRAALIEHIKKSENPNFPAVGSVLMYDRKSWNPK